MANVPLKTVKFPGLDNTYTVPQVDGTLSTAGAAADAKKVGDKFAAINNLGLSVVDGAINITYEEVSE